MLPSLSSLPILSITSPSSSDQFLFLLLVKQRCCFMLGLSVFWIAGDTSCHDFVQIELVFWVWVWKNGDCGEHEKSLNLWLWLLWLTGGALSVYITLYGFAIVCVLWYYLCIGLWLLYNLLYSNSVLLMRFKRGVCVCKKRFNRLHLWGLYCFRA